MTILEGIRIIDISQGEMGPYASMMAADMGADVIKIEPPGGDYARQWGPPFIDGVSPTYLSLNRNKQSVVIDLETGEGRDLLRRLVSGADVFIEDLTPANSERLGLTYERLAANHSSLIHLHVDYHGEKGPRANIPGAELPVQAMLDYNGGLGVPGEEPLRVGTDIGGLNGGTFAFQGLMTALLSRLDSGEGQRVSVSAAGALATLKNFMIAAPTNPDEWFGVHLDAWTKPPDQGYKTQDGALVLTLRGRGPGAEKYPDLMRALNMEEYTDHPWFERYGQASVGYGRFAIEAKPIWDERLSHFTTTEVRDILRENGAETVEFQSYDGVVKHPQVETIGILEQVPHPNGGTFTTVGEPFDLGPGTARETTIAPPALGHDTNAVLAVIGLNDAEIRDLRDRHVIA